jgi:hypothetical protein
VTKPTDTPARRPSTSASHAPATSSTTAAAGEVTALKAGWSQPAASTSAAVAAGRAPPTTNPKYRGPVVATRPGSTAVTSSSTCAAPVGPSRIDPRAARIVAMTSSGGATGASGTRAR